MKKMVEFCENNYTLGTRITKEKLDHNPKFDTMEYGCLGYCRQCRITPFALVEGKYIEEDELDELYLKITQLEEESMIDTIYDLIIKTEKKEG